MSKDLAEATKSEEAAITSYDGLMAAKTKEVEAATQAIETKTVRAGELAVEIVNMKNDLSDTEAALVEDKKFLADLEKNCKTKEAEWDEIVKVRQEELVALADTIKLLNDDDALELFKKTLPGASSFVQVQVSSDSARQSALAALRVAQKAAKNPKLDFIALALHGKKIGFTKVITMIDEMAEVLKKEQVDDNNKKEYCEVQFDSLEDAKKELERDVSDAEKSIEDSKETISTLASEIAALEDAIKALDKDVAEATAQRKAENEDFTTLMAQDTAAKELIGVAKNRLNKFYNPKLYVAPPKRELSEEDRIAVNMGGTAPPTPAPGGIAGTGIEVFVQVNMHTQIEYQKKAEEGAGVIAMMDLLLKDLENQITVGETEETNAQEDYETLMADSKEKRTADTKLLGDKMAAKAETDAALEKHTDEKAVTTEELQGNAAYIASLHADCDWLLENFDQRKEARVGEIDAMMKAKDVLQGADYSLLQVTHGHLRGVHQ